MDEAHVGYFPSTKRCRYASADSCYMAAAEEKCSVIGIGAERRPEAVLSGIQSVEQL